MVQTALVRITLVRWCCQVRSEGIRISISCLIFRWVCYSHFTSNKQTRNTFGRKRKMPWVESWSSSNSRSKRKPPHTPLPFSYQRYVRTEWRHPCSRFTWLQVNQKAAQWPGAMGCRDQGGHFRFERITVLLLLLKPDSFLNSPLWLDNGNTAVTINSISFRLKGIRLMCFLSKPSFQKIGW